MPKFFINENQIKENQIYIKGQDVKHIEKVLRNKIGDEIEYCYKDFEKKYIVESHTIIKDTDWSWLEPRDENRIVLITCV